MRARDLVAAGVALAALLVAVLAVGGAPRWAQGVTALVLLVALIPYLRSTKRPERFSPLILALGAAFLLTAIQLVPLPGALINAVNPTGAALRDDGTGLLGVHAWPSISMDWPGTLRALAVLAVLLGGAIVALRVSVTERGRYYVLAGVAAVGGLTALVVVVHKLLGIDQLYGFYTAQYAKPATIGPLLNENHLGCLMALSSTLACGLVFYRREPSVRRVMWLVVSLLCAGTTLATLSRGATMALCGGVCCTIGMLLGQRFAPDATARAPRSFRISSLPIAIVAVSAIVVVIYASSGGVSRELARTNLTEVSQPKSKYAAWSSSTELVRESPWFGQGRGAFETVFSRVHPASAQTTFAYLENEYLQTVVDWGIPGAIVFGVALLGVVVAALRRWRDGALAAAGIGSLAVVALQSNVDFGIELLGVALPAVFVAATLTYVPLRSVRQPAWTLGLRGGQLLALATAALLLLTSITATPAEDHQRLTEAGTPSMEAISATARRHPQDFFVYAVAAKVAAKTSPATSVPLLNHALRLAPYHPGLHLEAARMLYATGRKTQARIEYTAAMRSTATPQRVLAEVLSRFDSADAAAAIPSESPPQQIVQWVTAAERDDVAQLWLSRVLNERPKAILACELMFDVALRHGDSGAAASVRKQCRGFEPGTQQRLSLANVLFKKQAYDGARNLLSDVELWTGRVDTKATAWLLVCDSYVAESSWEQAKRCLRRLDAVGLVKLSDRGSITSRLDDIETRSHKIDQPSTAPAP